jgi:hypothetical protein
MFTGPRTYWLDSEHVCVQDTTEVRRDVRDVWPQIWHDRWAEAGWQFREELDAAGERVRLREKELPRGWVLRVRPSSGYELEHSRSGLLRQLPDWQWAELDRNRLVWTEKGCLFAANLDQETVVSSPKLLHDFNNMKFETKAAPS